MLLFFHVFFFLGNFDRQNINVALLQDDSLVKVSEVRVGSRRDKFNSGLEVKERGEKLSKLVGRRILVRFDQVRVPVLDTGALNPGNQVLQIVLINDVVRAVGMGG